MAATIQSASTDSAHSPRPQTTMRSGVRPAPLWMKLTLLLSTLALMWIAGEVGLRVFVGRPRTPTVLTSFVQHDPTVGWVGAPHAAWQFASTDFDVQISHDADGLRRCGLDWPISEDPRHAAEVVWCMGDSFAWGWGVDDGKTFVDRLNQQQRPGAKRIFRNLGLPGYGTVQEWLLLKERFATWPAPQRVLIYLSYNDFGDNVVAGESLQRPYFVVANGKAELRNLPAPAAVPWRVRSWMQKYSLVYNYFHYYLRAAQHAWDNFQTGQLGAPDPQEDPRTCGDATPEQVLAMRESLQRAKQLCTEHKVELLVASEKTGPAIMRLQALCKELSIGYLDLTPRWKQHFDSPEPAPLQFRHDPHYNEVGHELLAAAIGAELDRLPPASH
jgi:hypothetical protein